MHAHGYGAANFGRLARMIRKVPIIVHAHDDDRKYPLHQKIADRLLAKFTDKGIAVSESVKDSSVKKRRIREDKIDVIHNGIPLKEFCIPEKVRVQIERERLGVRPDFKVIGTVAKLREEKGVEYIIRAVVKIFDLIPKTVLLIAGDGHLRGELENLTRQLGIEDRVIFAGFCQDIPAILSIVDIVAVPSLTEGSPLALMEAMAMEKPIVATNVGGIREIMRNGETGLLVPSKDPEALAEKIILLLNDENKARHIGLNAKDESNKYDIDNHVKKLEDIYIQLASAQ
jgi:glycosyltransferase involved in cell wall biosynthesis